jgi:hypothetical protein
VIGVCLIVANALAFRIRLFNRTLAVLGVLAGVNWFLAAFIMWTELITGAQGSLVTTLEALRTFGGYVGSALYIIWAVWLGIWVLIRKP